VIQGLSGEIAWTESPIASYLVIGCPNGVVGMWQVVADEDQCNVTPLWMTTKGELSVHNATIQDAHGLSQLNNRLLKQRGAVGEPAHRLRDASKKLAAMASVISRLKSLSNETEEDPAFATSASVEQLEKCLYQAKNLVTSIKSTYGYKQ
jgi:hypothetical protein